MNLEKFRTVVEKVSKLFPDNDVGQQVLDYDSFAFGFVVYVDEENLLKIKQLANCCSFFSKFSDTDSPDFNQIKKHQLRKYLGKDIKVIFNA